MNYPPAQEWFIELKLITVTKLGLIMDDVRRQWFICAAAHMPGGEVYAVGP
jgi:hypothetical protein